MNPARNDRPLLLAEALRPKPPAAGVLDIECRRQTLTVMTGPRADETSAWLGTLAGFVPAVSGTLQLPEAANGTPRIGYVDVATPLLSTMDVRMNVMLPRLYHLGETHGAAQRAAEKLLERIGYAGPADVPPARLSPLEHRQALLARALALDPPLVFLDEPFTLGDVACWEVLENSIAALSENEQRAVVLVTRNLDFAAKVADRLVHVDGDRVSVHDSWDAFARAPGASAFLDHTPFRAGEVRA